MLDDFGADSYRTAMQVELVRTFHFESAHVLPNVPEDHKCRRMHGHSYVIDVTVAGEVDPEKGWLIDFTDLDDHFRPVYDALDHQVLNEIKGLENPTAEHIAKWIYDRMKPELPILAAISVAETARSKAIYRGA